MCRYNYRLVERKWQLRWEQAGAHRAVDNDARPKFYGLVEFPYPSGEGLHVGHPRSYTAMDIICRKRRMEGVNVLFPIGFDAFGLPAEQYAVKTKTQPAITTAKNIKHFTRQLKALGLSFDWSRVLATTDPDFYRWTQWIFLQLYRHGLAYRAAIPINWCADCTIGLAHEEVVDGRCERCGGVVTQKIRAQWLLKITAYAQRLIDGLALVDYPERVRQSQLNWIGRSAGATIKFAIRPPQSANAEIEVFTTRPDTIFGATFMVVAPENPILSNFASRITNYAAVQQYIAAAQAKTDVERSAVGREKTGVLLEGVEAINPASGQPIPVYVADYVLASYGTGAIMGVPAHDQRDYEFAKEYRLPIIHVVVPEAKIPNPKSKIPNNSKIRNSKFEIRNSPLLVQAYEAAEGVLVNSGQFSGQPVAEASTNITAWLASRALAKRAVSYKLRDWVFSRQRYWGEPIPLVYCKQCYAVSGQQSAASGRQGVDYVRLDGAGYAVVPIPEDQLPVTLPKIKNFQPAAAGAAPLAGVAGWVTTPCPRCGGAARRETDVMPNWAGSNWYYLRYCDPHNDQHLADPQRLQYWMGMPPARGGPSAAGAGGVDWYNGGMEHTTLHLLYSRFIYKFLWDIGAVPKACGPEPYKKRTSHGLILGAGGAKMSKSRGNVVNPDAVVAEFGADVLRLYEMFIGPFNQPSPWDARGIVGIKRFLDSLVGYVAWWRTAGRMPTADVAIEQPLQQAVRKVSADIEAMRFNTAVAQLMIMRNVLTAARSATAHPRRASQAQLETYLLLVAPFAPHLAEELWEQLDHRHCDRSHRGSLFAQTWPRSVAAKAQAATVTVVVQVNGKVRDLLTLPTGTSQAAAVAQARQRPNVQRYLAGVAKPRVVYVEDRLVNFVTTA